MRRMAEGGVGRGQSQSRGGSSEQPDINMQTTTAPTAPTAKGLGRTPDGLARGRLCRVLRGAARRPCACTRLRGEYRHGRCHRHRQPDRGTQAARLGQRRARPSGSASPHMGRGTGRDGHPARRRAGHLLRTDASRRFELLHGLAFRPLFLCRERRLGPAERPRGQHVVDQFLRPLPKHDQLRGDHDGSSMLLHADRLALGGVLWYGCGYGHDRRASRQHNLGRSGDGRLCCGSGLPVV